jgi:hypothetical protein
LFDRLQPNFLGGLLLQGSDNYFYALSAINPVQEKLNRAG